MDDLDDDIIDEEDPESQESHGWIESRKPPPSVPGNTGAGSSSQHGDKVNSAYYGEHTQAVEVQGSVFKHCDVLQEMYNLAAGLNPGLDVDLHINHPKQGMNHVRDLQSKRQDVSPQKTSSVELVGQEQKDAQESSKSDACILHEWGNQTMDTQDNSSGAKKTVSHEEPPVVLDTPEDNITNANDDGDRAQLIGETRMVVGHQDDMVDNMLRLLDMLQFDKTQSIQMNGGVPPPKEVSLDLNKASHCTRQSARGQDKDVLVLEKVMARKVGIKGTIVLSKPHVPTHPCLLDDISRVCGFNLGHDEATRLANISLIQAKGEALVALLQTKQKLKSSSVDNRDLSNSESSDVHFSPDLELIEGRAVEDDNLSLLDQG